MSISRETITWAPIIPLIGGLPLAIGKLFNKHPEYVLSWSPFQHNDNHYVNYIRKHGWTGKYYVLDHVAESVIPDVTSDFDETTIPHVDVIGGTPPCAGLSSLSVTSNAESAVNDWMLKAAEFVLGTCKPKIYWFENAPRLGTEKGKPVADKLFAIGKRHGYSFMIYTTESRLHGNCQIRPRTFGFFFDNNYFDNSINVLPNIPHTKGIFEEYMTEVAKQLEHREKTIMDEPINRDNPADNPYYTYCYEAVKAESHRDFIEKICTYEKSVNLLEETLKRGNYDYEALADWFDAHNFERTAKRMRFIKSKVDDGKGYWTHGITVGRGQIPAFIGVMPMSLVHPYEQRFVTFREGLTLMGFPEDYELNTDKPWSCANHICQNVPVGTAAAMVEGIINWLENPKRDSFDAVYAIQRNKQRDIQVRVEVPSMTDSLFD